MYQQYFGLSEAPFSIAPDPRYLYLSDKHREALAHLIYGVGDQGGFVVLTGEVGTGKTTICRCLLQQVPENTDIAFIINPKQSINQLLQSICNDLNVDYKKGITSKDLIDLLNNYLLSAHGRGRNTILLIDEAQNLSVDVLEQLRLLTNLETNEKKLLQLVLLGQPELNDLLVKSELRQLAQRITARYHLYPLSKVEVAEYIEHRLSVAGCRTELFPANSVSKVFQFSKGVPRLINLVCDRALLGVYSSNGSQATPKIVSKAAKEIILPVTPNKWRPVWIASCLAFIFLSAIVFWKYQIQPLKYQDSEQALIIDGDNIKQSKPIPTSINLSGLFKLWSLPTDNNMSTCDQSLRENSLYCLTSFDSLDELLQYNVPAFVRLKDTKGENLDVVLKSLIDGQVSLVESSKSYVLPLSELQSYTFKFALAISRIHPNLRLPIAPGEHNSMIGWLLKTLLIDEELTVIAGSPLVYDMESPDGKISKMALLYKHYLHFDTLDNKTEYDQSLVSLITATQKQFGLPPTGIIDLPLLNALTKERFNGDPVLIHQAGEAG